MSGKLIAKVIILWIAIALAVGCEIKVRTEQSERPPNVPESALWVGGADGGVYVLVHKQNRVDSNLYATEVYYASGDIAYKGMMRLYPESSDGFIQDKKESFVAWDGDSLYLTNNRYLRVQTQ